MPKAIRVLIFVLIEIVLLPVTLVGMILFIIDFTVSSFGKKMAITTYDPMIARWMWHGLGRREDPAAAQLAYGLPGISRVPFSLAFGPTVLAMRISGYYAEIYDYPIQPPASLMNGMLGQRTTYYDRVIEAHLDDVDQFVVLGAGWDTRCYGMAKRDGLAVFEVDEPHTQAVKRAALDKAGIDSGHVGFAAADFDTESWLDALVRVGFDPDKKTFVLWEFVAVYVEPQAVAATLETVAHDLAPGSFIAFEAMAEYILNGEHPVWRFAQWELKLIGEEWRFGLPTDPPVEDHAAAYLAEHGLTLADFEPLGSTDRQGRQHGIYMLARNG